MKKNILLITYYWPPSGGAGVIRWLMFSKYLSKSKYNLFVYTPENPEAQFIDTSFEKHIHKDITIVKKKIWEPYSIFKKITRTKDSINAGFLNENKSGSSGFFAKLSLLIRANFFIPDAKMLWIIPSTMFLKKIVDEKNIDLIITSGPPHSLNLIGRNISRKKKNIKWISDFRDPWTNIDFIKDLPMSWLAKKIQQKLEKSVLKEADRVMIVGEQWRQDLLKIHNREIELLPNGFEIDFPKNYSLNSKFTIVHLGNINPDRSHEAFFKGINKFIFENLKSKDRIQIQFIGKVDIKAREYIKQYQLEEIVEYIKYIDHENVGLYLKQAHVLYLPINRTPNANGILTGKFYEYLAAQRPIIAQGLKNSEIDRTIKESNSGVLIDFDDSLMIQKTVTNYFSDYLENKSFELNNNINKYSRKNLTKKLEDIIDELLSNQ